MEKSKIQLSEEELLLVQNSAWILTKQGIIEKVYSMFGNMVLRMQSSWQLQESAAVSPSSPKISKGERYHDLPYVVLDYPRFFSKENVLAIRTFFWWGNYFSISLHLKGTFKQQFYKAITRAIDNGRLAGYYLSLEGNEFNFKLDNGDYQIINSNSRVLPEQVKNAEFLKIAFRHSFDDWDTAQDKLMEAFQYFAGIITR